MHYSFVSRAVMKRGASDEMNVPASTDGERSLIVW